MSPGETPLECAKRELYEETGLQPQFNTMNAYPPKGLYAYEEHTLPNGDLHMNFCFVAHVPKIVSIETKQDIVEYNEWDWFMRADRRWIGRVTGLPAAPLPNNVREIMEEISVYLE